ncbi:MAG: ATP-dependent Clp protease proteolytic subunit [Hyphomicrobium sp.]
MVPTGALNRWLWIAVLVAIVVLGFKTRDRIDILFARVGSLDVIDEPERGAVLLKWTGAIEAPMASRIAEAYAQHRATAKVFILSLSSPGGTLNQGGEVARLLREISTTHRLETTVEDGARCASMCVPVYLQGQRRSAAPDAQFMFHEVSFSEIGTEGDLKVPESARARETDRLFDRYFPAAGVPADWIAKTRADMAGGHDVWKSARELVDEKAGIVQELF